MAKPYSTTSTRTVYTSDRIRIDYDAPRDYSLYLDNQYAGSHASCAEAENEGAVWLAQQAGAIPVDPEPQVTVMQRTLIGGIPGDDDVIEIASRWRRVVLCLDAGDPHGAALVNVDTDALTLDDLRTLRAIFTHPALAAYLDR